MKQDIICAAVPDTPELGTAVGEFLRTIRPERQRLYDYYRGEQPVNKGEAVRGRPNNLLRAPFPRYIAEVHTGYFLGAPPSIVYGDGASSAHYAALSRDVFCQVKIPGWGCGQNLGPNKATGGSACTPMSSEWRQSNFI